ncbi:MAG TPA: hypothetical protein VJ436_03700 [Anaerolineales bacterium]|nr:hypothetical protein [Anaerolineales bacterium]
MAQAVSVAGEWTNHDYRSHLLMEAPVDFVLASSVEQPGDGDQNIRY